MRGSQAVERVAVNRWRWGGGTVVGLITVAVTSQWLGVTHPDFLIARRAADTLFSTRALETYVRHPDAQMGPLALALSRLPRRVYYIGVAALVAVVGPLLASSSPYEKSRSRTYLTATVWGLAVAVPWSQLAFKGHVDDALVLIGASLLLWARARQRLPAQIAAVTLALLGKPTAVVLVVALLPSSVAFSFGLCAIALVWAPFMLLDPQAMLQAGKGVMFVARGSSLNWIGLAVGSRPPSWVRLGEVVFGVGAVAMGVVRHRVAEGVILAFALRALLEPNPAPAYCIPLVVLALVPDLTLGLPVFTAVSLAAFHLSQGTLNGGPSWPRLMTLVALVLLCVGRCVVHDSRSRP